jgi:hypothetical protein
VTDRNIFNRSYTSFDSSGSEVWLVNGGGITSNYTAPYVLFAGENLIQGDVVYASGAGVAVKATALSGVDSNFYYPIGVAATSASAGTEVQVNLDGVVVVDGSNITAGSQLIPGQDYFLSKYKGQVTLYATGSGVILASGLNQYGASVRVGRAISVSELEVEIQPPILLVN